MKEEQTQKNQWGVGLEKDAIDVIEVAFFTRTGHKVELSDPKEVELFLSKLEKMELPTDPIFRPHRILLVHQRKMTKEEVLREYRLPRLLLSMDSKEPINATPEKEEEILRYPSYTNENIEVIEQAGKGVRFNDRLYRVPSLKEMEEKLPYIIEDENKRAEEEEESNRRINRMLSIQASMASSLSSMSPSYIDMQEILKNKAEKKLGITEEDKKKNEKLEKSENKKWYQRLMK